MKNTRRCQYLTFLTGILLWLPMVCGAQSLPQVPQEVVKVEFEAAGHRYSVEIVPEKSAELDQAEEGSGYCGNPEASPELHAECDLILKDGNTELSRLSLGECSFVHHQNKWVVRGFSPLSLLKKKEDYPIISFSQYAGCNGNIQYFFWVEAQKDQLALKPLNFMSYPCMVENNQLWVSPAEDSVQLTLSPQTHRYEIWINGYDNAGLFSFVAQYGEISPGHWHCIGFYTEAAGTYEAIKKKIFKK